MLNNIYWALPEIFLSIGIVGLLWYGVIASKLGKKVSRLIEINYISIGLLIITGILVKKSIKFFYWSNPFYNGFDNSLN